MTYDVDWVVVGSGFGGSVSALRLAEKGYSVRVLECGRRFEDEDFAETTADVKRYQWAPMLGLKGIFRMTLFKDVFVVSGSGVGGGSLGYANALYRSRPAFGQNPQWSHLADWDTELAPHYETAERMLGVVDYDRDSVVGQLIEEYAVERGFGESYARTRVGVYLGAAGETVADPYFDGDGPDRAGCVRCGACLVGCRHNAKNTLPKNYLWFAEQRGAVIEAERTVVDIRPLGAADGSQGYAVTSVRSGRWLAKGRRTLTARGVVVAAGPLGTNRLLLRCKLSGSLPRISDRIGKLVRTNSETNLAVTARGDVDFGEAVTITASIAPDPDTRIEPFTYGRAGDSQSLLTALATTRGGRFTRPAFFLANVVRQPRDFLRTYAVRGSSARSVILLVMQTVESSIELRVRFRLPGGYPVLTTAADPDHPIETTLPPAYECGEWLARRIDGTLRAAVPEALFAIPTTAHLLGGAVIGESPATGVVDLRHEVFGYHGLLVCDGAAVPADVGVNPSLTITAMAERAMSFIPSRAGAEVAPPIRFTDPA